MLILKIAVFSLVSAYCVIVVKEYKPEIAMIIGVSSGIIIIILLSDHYLGVLNEVITLFESVGIKSDVIKYLIKIVSTGLITDFAATTIEESGQKSLSEKVTFAGKIVILSMTIPIIKITFEIVGKIL